MAFYVMRFIKTSAAVNTYTNLTNDGSNTNVGAIQVPVGVSAIVQIVLAFAADSLTVAATGGVVFLRLTGNGLTDGQQELSLGGFSYITTTSGAAAVWAQTTLATAIRTIVGNTITPQATQSGVTVTSQDYAVTLVFQ